ncbi:MAG: S26 family signal peptidase [Candidatus Levybacteria bacterium]|nr:S26 family signal peptidase [Candidatus Levybacteria bacterium]
MLLTKFKIKGHSMGTLLKENQSVLVSSLPFIFFKPRIRDVVIFKFNNKFYIKRIMKKKGDKYFLRGDNRRDSLDSKKIGWVDKKDIIGKVIFKISN